MANKTLTATATWDEPKSVVNGDPDDQAMDEDCHQRHANRAEWLRTRINAHAALATGAHAASAISVVPIGEIITTDNVQAALGELQTSAIELGNIAEQAEIKRPRLVGHTYKRGATTSITLEEVPVLVESETPGNPSIPLVFEVPNVRQGDRVLVHAQMCARHEVTPPAAGLHYVVSVTRREGSNRQVSYVSLPSKHEGCIELSGVDVIGAGCDGTVHYDVLVSGEGTFTCSGSITVWAMRFRG